jgi:hypothetical protein
MQCDHVCTVGVDNSFELSHRKKIIARNALRKTISEDSIRYARNRGMNFSEPHFGCVGEGKSARAQS